MLPQVSSPERSQKRRMERFIMVFLPMSTAELPRRPYGSTYIVGTHIRQDVPAAASPDARASPGRRGLVADRANVHELLRAYVIRVDDEGAVKLLQVAAQLGIILRAACATELPASSLQFTLPT